MVEYWLFRRKSVEEEKNLVPFLSRSKAFNELNDPMKRFWEVETLGIDENYAIPIKREEIVLDKVLVSFVHDGEHYQVFHPHSFVSVEVVEDNRWKLKPENWSSWYNSRE